MGAIHGHFPLRHIFVSYYNILTKETSRKGTKIQYKIAFDIEDHIDFDVVKNNRLLIKLKNGQLITLEQIKIVLRVICQMVNIMLLLVM